MAMISVARAGANIGSFSPEEIREGLRSGRFLTTDLGWKEGMAEWRALPEIAAAEGPVPLSAATTTTASGSTSETLAPGSGLPWEHRERLGIFKAFFDTVILILSQPTAAFGIMKTEGGLTDPLLFALIGGSAGMIVSFLFQIGLQSLGYLGDGKNAISGIFGMGIGIVVFILIMPILVIVGMFVGSGILHLCLMIVGGARKPFETTFRVVAFSCGATYLLALIPICGGAIAGIYNIVLQCLGLARTHEIAAGRALIAVLLPLIICCGGALLLAFLVGGIGALTELSRH
jgi:hypothetical protein